jgi:5-methylcytosine-specific restriction endonuclease McrA
MPRKAKKKRTWNLQAAVYSALRRIFRTYPAYQDCRNRVKEEYFIKSKKGKPMRRVRFVCELCGTKVTNKKICCDHIEPVIPIEGLKKQANGLPDFNQYIDRLFCGPENLQVICEKCHKSKSAEESKARKKGKKK